MINEPMIDSLEKFWLRKSKLLFLSKFYIRFFLFKKISDSLIPSFYERCERFAQVAQDKWATLSELLRLLMTNEWPWTIRSKNLAKKSKILFLSMFYIRLFICSFPLFYERCEWIAQVAHQKWAMWANRSCCSPKMSNHEQFSQVTHQKWATMSKSLRSLTKNNQMSESLDFFDKSLFCSFFRKKQVIRSENRWANSQPCMKLSRTWGWLL